MRWPDAFSYPRCGGQDYGTVHGLHHKRHQCRQCRHHATLTACTIMVATKVPLTIWFLAFYLIG